MANNLHIAYDLNAPGKNYDALIAKIKTLGAWAHIQKSLWYVNSELTASEAAAALWVLMDATDVLYIVDATNRTAAWYNLSESIVNQIQEYWFK